MKYRNKVVLSATTLLFVLSLSAAFAQVLVGVKKGDWIEYHVTTTGTPEEGHDVDWARMEILDVRGTEISVNITTRARNGTFASEIEVFDPANGQVGVWFLIPADLDVGESFFDSSVGNNVTIEGAKQRIIAGAMRTVTHSTTPERVKSWDKAKGVFVETVDVLPNTTLYAIADKTNMWSEPILGIDRQLFILSYFTTVTVLTAAIFILAFAYFRTKRLIAKKQG